jgi:hypothetical protein
MYGIFNVLQVNCVSCCGNNPKYKKMQYIQTQQYQGKKINGFFLYRNVKEIIDNPVGDEQHNNGYPPDPDKPSGKEHMCRYQFINHLTSL